MFYSLTGKLTYQDPQTAVVDCGGVGFKCFVTLNTVRQLPSVGNTVMLYTHLNVKEDALDLYGFYSMQELEAFKLITSVNGVGPKVGLSILSAFTSDKLALLIATGDAKSLTAASGVGAKLAQRITLELKDKYNSGALTVNEDIEKAGVVSASAGASEAVGALVALGYTQSEASLAIGRLDSSLPVEILIKEALKALSRQVR
ncbi:MAG: Holliday junction DNA helicase RuvA [Clostridiales bacterium 43-6]|nr:MAG: Holliday junction DNA helicase RuvA [Clostridiales bacterium 43-6]